MPGQDEATWGLTFSPLDKAQELGGGPSVRGNDLEFVTSPGQGAKKRFIVVPSSASVLLRLITIGIRAGTVETLQGGQTPLPIDST